MARHAPIIRAMPPHINSAKIGYNRGMDKWLRLLVTLSTLLLLIAFVAVAVRLSMTIHHTLLLFALGGLVAYALDPLVERLSRGRIKRPAAVASVFVGLFVLLGLAGWSLEGHLAAQVRELPTYKTHALAFAQIVDQRLAARHIHYSLTQTIEHPPQNVQNELKKLGASAIPILRESATDVGEFVVVLLFALYFLIFGTDMRQKFNGLLPTSLSERAELWETDVNRILGGFVRGQITIAIIMGVLAGLGCLVVGIKFWLIIGLFVIVAAIIPVFGPYLGAIPAVLAALIGPTHFHNNVVAAALILLWFIFINEGGSKVLYPKLVGAALGLHEVLVLFVLFAGLEINGIVGVLFAAPVTAIAIVSVVHLYRLWQDLPDSLLSNVARRDARSQGEVAPLPAPAPPPTGGSTEAAKTS
jgi:predicted PurR-regulated permease PerM